MKSTRRQLLLATPLAALAHARAFDEDRLGVYCDLGSSEQSARRALAAARGAGFRRVQIFFPWANVTGLFLWSLPAWLRNEGLEPVVLSVYLNCCQPETVLMDCRRADLARAIDLCGVLECHRLVAWTGGYARSVFEADVRNYEPAAATAIVKFLEGYLSRLQEARLTLALESYFTLACPDAPSLRRLLNRLPHTIGAVLDPPNLTAPDRFARRDQLLRDITGTLRDRVQIAHLKDFKLAPDGATYELPGPLKGAMNYRLYVQQLLSLPASVPLIVEHLAAEDYRDTRLKLLSVFSGRPSPGARLSAAP